MRKTNRSGRRRQRRDDDLPELNVTPFMNLMIVLVPVLLLSLVFTHTTVIELDFPAAAASSEVSSEVLHLEISILSDELVIADNRGVVKRLPRIEGMHDFLGLNLTLQAIKQRMPDKRDATILLEPATDYQALVFVMDSVRSYRTVQAGDAIQAELFPDMSLGDVPVQLAQGGPS